MNAEQLIERTGGPVNPGNKLVHLVDGLEENLCLLEVLNDYLLNLANEGVKEGGVHLSAEEAGRISFFVSKFIIDVRNVIEEVK